MDATGPAARIPLVVVGGWLGAGKTTLVNRLLRHAGGQRIAVLVNDFGEVGIDADLIEGGMEAGVMALAGGCLCCSYGADLVGSLRQIAARTPPPDLILLECSGVGLPAAVARSAALAPEVAVQGTVGLVDVSAVRRQATEPYVGDTVGQQLREADLLLLNHADRLDAGGLQAVQHWLAAQAPGVPQAPCSRAAVPPDLVLGLSPQRRPDGAEAAEAWPRAGDGRYRNQQPGAAKSRFRFETRRYEGPTDVQSLAAALGAEAGLLRAKGHLRGHDGRLWRLQAMGRRVELTALEEIDGTALTALGLLACISLKA